MRRKRSIQLYDISDPVVRNRGVTQDLLTGIHLLRLCDGYYCSAPLRLSWLKMMMMTASRIVGSKIGLTCGTFHSVHNSRGS